MQTNDLQALDYWTMGEKYLHVARLIAEQIVANKNEFSIFIHKQAGLTARETEKQLVNKTKWSDINITDLATECTSSAQVGNLLYCLSVGTRGRKTKI
jgi:hypothetical protein